MIKAWVVAVHDFDSEVFQGAWDDEAEARGYAARLTIALPAGDHRTVEVHEMELHVSGVVASELASERALAAGLRSELRRAMDANLALLAEVRAMGPRSLPTSPTQKKGDA